MHLIRSFINGKLKGKRSKRQDTQFSLGPVFWTTNALHIIWHVLFLVFKICLWREHYHLGESWLSQNPLDKKVMPPPFKWCSLYYWKENVYLYSQTQFFQPHKVWLFFWHQEFTVDTGWTSYKSTQLWHSLLEES